MTRGLTRYQQTGDLHFITFSCHERRSYLNTSAARDLFEYSLETIRRRYDFFITAYVVMPEHVHILMSEPQQGSLSRAIQAIKLSVSTKRPERPFWTPRYYDFNVYGARKLIEKRRYIHRNPITRGLVKEPDEWKWSSFHHWWTGEAGAVEIESNWTARRREASITSPQEVLKP
jgi:putative transposase